jgi:hypothetical protein
MIPIQNTGSTGPDFSISASDLSYISKPLIPGAPVKFSAVILNNSKSFLSKDLRVLFKLKDVTNGITKEIKSWNFKVSKSFLKPLQYYVVTKEWIVPTNLPANSVFEVVLDPAAPDRDFPGENSSDNTASVILDAYGPDLEVTADCLSWLPKEPQAGGNVTLYAGIRNTGLSSTQSSCKAKFFIDENMVGETDVPSIQGVSGFVASCSWNIPKAPELAPLEWETLEGEPGKLPIPSGATKDLKFKVQVDTGNTVTETNEDNNVTEKNLTVYVPYTKGVVYIRVFDDIGNVNIADVELKTAGGILTNTFTDEYGWCTFTGVPFGSYTITVKKDKYEDLIYNYQTAQGRLTTVNELKLTRKAGSPYFSATASTLKGITALKVDFSCDSLDADRPNSDFIFEWIDTTGIISDSTSFNYVFVEPKIHYVNINIHSQDGIIVFTKSFNIEVTPPLISIIDDGRKIVSVGSIFVDKLKYDIDKDGINQAWEDAAMVLANPQIELDEDEHLLEEPTHRVVNFVRISPYTSKANAKYGLLANEKYILFIYGITWSRDYGLYTIEAHNGDIENVTMIWKVIDDKTLELKYVYTSAHANADTDHSGIWKATGESTNKGKIKLWPNQSMKAALEFNYISSTQSVLKVYASENKHAIYPTASCGNSAKLVWVGWAASLLVLGTVLPLPIFVEESVGGGGTYRFTCYNIGEEYTEEMKQYYSNTQLNDNIESIFPNERVWSGNIDNPTRFAGGLDVKDGMGSIGGTLSGVCNMLFQEMFPYPMSPIN